MSILRNILDVCVDFIYPQSIEVSELEHLTTEELIKLLPCSTDDVDKDTIAIFDYHDKRVKKIIWEIKYHGNERLADKIGGIIYDYIKTELSDKALFDSASWQTENPLLIPIPISSKRQGERGWNQSELLAKKVIAKDLGKTLEYLPNELVKVHHTESQTKTRSRRERLSNVTNSMEIIHPQLFRDRCVIVLDDVTTTGATFAEARRALKLAGVKKILCVAVAH